MATPPLPSARFARATQLAHLPPPPLLQVLEQQVRSLQEKVAALQAAAEARQAARRWLPELPDTVSTRQALLGACLLASGTAAAALMYGRRSAAAAAAQ